MSSHPPVQSPTSEDMHEAHRFFQAMEDLLSGHGGFAPLYGLSQEDVETMAEQGDMLLQANRLTDAETLYEGCVLMEPTDARHLCRLGSVRALQGRWDEARPCFSLARDVSPDASLVDRYLKATFDTALPS